jgi:hypothetical protein
MQDREFQDFDLHNWIAAHVHVYVQPISNTSWISGFPASMPGTKISLPVVRQVTSIVSFLVVEIIDSRRTRSTPYDVRSRRSL